MRTITLAEAGMESTKDKVYTYPTITRIKDEWKSEYIPGNPDYSPDPKYWKQSGIPTHKFTYDPKPMDAVKWLTLAVSDERTTPETYHREPLRFLHPSKKHTFGANGYLVHRVWNGKLVKKTYKGKDVIPNVELIYRQHHSAIVQVSRYHVLRAIAACEVFAKETSSNIVRMSVNGDMKFMAQSAETGDTTVVIENGDNWSDVKAPNSGGEQVAMAHKRAKLFGRDYTDAVYIKQGDDVEIAFNYKYLKNIVLGMPDVFNIGLVSSASPAVVWGEVDGVLRDACLMPMSIGR